MAHEIIRAVLICLAAVFVLSCSEKKQKKPSTDKPIVLEYEVYLWNAYGGDNEAAADAKYLNKPVEFVVTAGRISKDNSGQYYIFSDGVVCRFVPQDFEKLAAAKTMLMKVRGICDGKRRHGDQYTVEVIDCRIVAFYSWDDKNKKLVEEK